VLTLLLAHLGKPMFEYAPELAQSVWQLLSGEPALVEPVSEVQQVCWLTEPRLNIHATCDLRELALGSWPCRRPAAVRIFGGSRQRVRGTGGRGGGCA
jgi:hypothetical protein